jgi:hypothetical protein
MFSSFFILATVISHLKAPDGMLFCNTILVVDYPTPMHQCAMTPNFRYPPAI